MFAWLGRLGIRQINAHHWRSLSKPIAFEHFLVETFLKMTRKIERQFFGAGDDESQSLKLLRFGFTQIQTQKSRCEQEERQPVSIDQLRAFRRVQWIRIRDDAHTFDQRIPKCYCRSERVEERQRRQNRICFLRIEQFLKLLNVSHHIAMTHYCTFRCARLFLGCSITAIANAPVKSAR